MKTFIRLCPTLAIASLMILITFKMTQILAFLFLGLFIITAIIHIVDTVYFFTDKETYLLKSVEFHLPEVSNKLKVKSRKEIDKEVGRFVHDIGSDTGPISLKKYTSFGDKS